MSAAGVTGAGLSVGRWLGSVAGFFSGWRLLYLIIPAAAGLLTSGFFVGMKWSEGMNAIGVLAKVDEKLDSMQVTLDRYDESSKRFETNREDIERFFRSGDADYRSWAEENRERLADCGIGADGLRLWNLWNEGATEAPAPR